MADAPASPTLPPNLPGSKKVENPQTVLILGFVTCGIYCLYWMWLRTKEMNEYLGKQQINPMFVFPGCICGNPDQFLISLNHCAARLSWSKADSTSLRGCLTPLLS